MKTESIVITRTPFRLSFFGGGTDLPGYFNQHEGCVLTTTINKYLYVTINSLKRFYDKRIRLSYSKLENVDNLQELDHAIVRAILADHELFDQDSFIDMHTYADLPASSGMGSSSTFTVGFLNALYSLSGIFKNPYEIAKEAIYIEREKMQEAGGWQDQIASAFGGFNIIHFKNNEFLVEPVVISTEKKRALENACLLFFTGGTRSSAAIQQQVFANPMDKTTQLHHLKSSVFKALDILRNSQTSTELIDEFGRLLHEGWQIKQSLSPHISSQGINDMYDAALRAGAIGGKLCGAGGGGFLLLITPEEKRNSVIAALNQHAYVNIQFDSFGSRIIHSELRA